MKLNSEGFTLIEALIVGAIISVIALAFATMMDGQVRQQRRLEMKANMLQLQNSLSQAANNPATIVNSSLHRVPVAPPAAP